MELERNLAMNHKEYREVLEEYYAAKEANGQIRKDRRADWGRAKWNEKERSNALPLREGQGKELAHRFLVVMKVVFSLAALWRAWCLFCYSGTSDEIFRFS